MQDVLNLNQLPTYCFSSFRYFSEGEKHVTRISNEDVLLLVFDGVLRFCEDGQPVEVSKGQYYIQRKGLRQEGSLESDMPQYYYIHFLGNFTDEKNGLPLRGEADMPELFPLFQKLDFLHLSKAPAVEICAVFYAILSALNRNFANTERRQLVTKIISMAVQDVQAPVSLDEIARQCGYSKNYIIHIFKSETGQTPYVYITKMKFAMAKQLLAASEMPVAQIAVECGFGNYINLYKEFVKSEGCSPQMWRSRQRNIGAGHPFSEK